MKRGYLLVSLIRPMLVIFVVIGVCIWLVLSRWSTFSSQIQLGLKVAGAVALLALVGANVWTASRGGGTHRGF